MSQLYEKARTYIYQNARPIDLARFKYHFENGSKEEVLKVLSYFQNEDGSFGYGLELNDYHKNPVLAKIHKAIRIIEEIDLNEKEHPIIQGILIFLTSGKCFDRYMNPLAALAGFVVCFADKESALYETGCHIVQEAYDHIIFDNCKNDIYTVCCYIQMLDYLKKAKETELIDLIVLEVRLRGIVKRSITLDKKEWKNEYVCKPSQFFTSRNSIFYQDNAEIADYECEFICDMQLKDDTYFILPDYAKEWEVNRIWRKAEIMITNLLYLKGMGVISKNGRGTWSSRARL